MSTQVNISCKNCGHPLKENYCSNCGQKADVRRFDGRYILDQLIHSIDLDRGFFHTLWLLLKNPGNAIRNYIAGKRIGFSNPFKMVIILGTIATFLTLNSEHFVVDDKDLWETEFLSEWPGFVAYSGRYFSFFTLTGIPIYSLFTWLLFLKSGYNFSENLILNIYIASGQFMLPILLLPINYLIDGQTFYVTYGILNFGYNVWVLIVFFKANAFNSITRILVAVVIPIPLGALMNYWLYVLAPDRFWEYLDRVLL